MIRFVEGKEIDRGRWDALIASSVNGNVYAYSWYLDAVCPRWDALIEDDYKAVMPLVYNKKYFLKYIYPPKFSQQLGLFESESSGIDRSAEFLNAVPGIFRLVEMNLNVFNKSVPGPFTSQSNRNLMLKMGRVYKEIASGYNENHRRNIRKASEKGLTYESGHQPAAIVQLFRENRGQSIRNLKDDDYIRFLNLAETAISRKAAKIITAHLSGGAACAGAVFFESHQKAYFIFSGISAEGRAASAMHGIIDYFISENCTRLKYLDFEGSNNSDLARFYSGFGSDEYLYLQVRRNTLPAPWKWFKH